MVQRFSYAAFCTLIRSSLTSTTESNPSLTSTIKFNPDLVEREEGVKVALFRGNFRARCTAHFTKLRESGRASELETLPQEDIDEVTSVLDSFYTVKPKLAIHYKWKRTCVLEYVFFRATSLLSF